MSIGAADGAVDDGQNDEVQLLDRAEPAGVPVSQRAAQPLTIEIYEVLVRLLMVDSNIRARLS